MAKIIGLAELCKLLDEEIQKREGLPECVLTMNLSWFNEKLVMDTCIDEVEYDEEEGEFFLFCTTGNLRFQNYSIHESEVEECYVDECSVDANGKADIKKYTIVKKNGSKTSIDI